MKKTKLSKLEKLQSIYRCIYSEKGYHYMYEDPNNNNLWRCFYCSSFGTMNALENTEKEYKLKTPIKRLKNV